MLKFYQNVVKTKVFTILLLGVGASLFLIPEAYAFSAPIVKATDSFTRHIVIIGVAAGALAIAHFLYTLYIGEPAWKRLIYTLLAITCFTGFTALFDWVKRGMN